MIPIGLTLDLATLPAPFEGLDLQQSCTTWQCCSVHSAESGILSFHIEQLILFYVSVLKA